MNRTIRWDRGTVVTIDQRLLPLRYRVVRLRTSRQVLTALGNMTIRGAPLIGAASAYALALEAFRNRGRSKVQILTRLRGVSKDLLSCRPTGRDMGKAIKRILDTAESEKTELWKGVLSEAEEIAKEYEATERRIVDIGQAVIKEGDVVLTHCNSGRLATVAWGTALGVVIEAWKAGKRISVIATETRPLLQGARLTAWELKHHGVPFKLVTDSMVGYVMARNLVSKVLVGADRIWRDGSVANKIGTLTIATAAKEYGVPFYVVAPTSTFDLEGIPSYDVIENRDSREILDIGGVRIAPKGTQCLNPAFDITPPDHITAMVTDRGILRPPFEESIGRNLSG